MEVDAFEDPTPKLAASTAVDRWLFRTPISCTAGDLGVVLEAFDGDVTVVVGVVFVGSGRLRRVIPPNPRRLLRLSLSVVEFLRGVVGAFLEVFGCVVLGRFDGLAIFCGR